VWRDAGTGRGPLEGTGVPCEGIGSQPGVLQSSASLKEGVGRVDGRGVSVLRSRRLCLASRLAAAVVAVAVGVSPAASGWAEPDEPGVDFDTDLDEAVERHDEVQQAREELEAARARAAALAEELERATERYEEARAHKARLEDEAEELAEAVEAANEAVATAEAAFAEAAVATYKRPGTAVEAGRAVLASTSRRNALHRAALVDRILAGERRHGQQVVRQQQRVADVRDQHRTVRAGIEGAEQQAAEAAERLEAAREAARAHVEQAAAELEVTEAEIREQIRAEREAERRRLAQRRRQQRSQTGGRGRTVLPSDGALATMACPMAEPHSFIDSWRFPRSGGRVHEGVDIFADRGTPIFAAADGTVRRVWHNRLGGLSIDLVDERGDRYYYAHLDAAHVASGQPVSAGQHIADNGNSGNARHTPPHLHWQYHPGDGEPVNPYPLARALCG
jgi:murein DD-endopeptidase MepM/ murein hydrolase activator NlpD